jgi:hypothetical protein
LQSHIDLANSSCFAAASAIMSPPPPFFLQAPKENSEAVARNAIVRFRVPML